MNHDFQQTPLPLREWLIGLCTSPIVSLVLKPVNHLRGSGGKKY